MIIIVLTMKQMMDKVIPRVAVEWKQLAYMLEFDISRVKIIEKRDDPCRSLHVVSYCVNGLAQIMA